MNKSETTLLRLFGSMTADAQQALVEYAEFLADRHPVESVSTTPVDIPRPENESVIAAIKRLSNTYSMLDKQALLHETSTFMMQHVMQGRESLEVIDDMEIYFKQQYEQHCQKSRGNTET